MESLLAWMSEQNPVLLALLATTFTWLSTAIGAAFVFPFKKVPRGLFDGLLGFSGGVMIAASFWSLLAPALEMSEEMYPDAKWFPAATGFLLGALFLFALDKFLPHLHINFDDEEKEGVKTEFKRPTLLVLAITLHNIPEGLAIGVLFGGAALGLPGASLSAALVLTMGMALQNLPEGVAVAMPLRRSGMSRRKSFFYGQLSAVVEPIAGVIGAIAVVYIQPILPFALAFAAGAMIFVVVEEVIPETQREKYTDIAVLGFILGFVVMMILDTAFS
jgi:ZIP family zinc transporter